MTPPFADMGEAAVCARVALALIRRKRTHADFSDISPHILIGVTVSHLQGLHLPTVRLALLSVSVWVRAGGHTRDWLAGVLYRDMLRLPIRRCYYAEYKANRRVSPPC